MSDPAPARASRAWPPRGLTGWLASRVVPADADPTTAEHRARLGILQGWVSAVVNGGLFLVKMVLGLWLGSVALMADAVHSLSDVGTSFVVILGFWWARKPRDSRHPFGHGRVELVTALVIAILLVVLAIEFVRFGISRILSPRVLDVPFWMIIVVFVTLLIKQWVAFFAQALARATSSQALAADYWHHVADVMSTGLVIVALLAARVGWDGADGWAALGIAGFILWTGWVTARDAIHPLLGEAPCPEEIRRIETAGQGVKGVRGVHDLILHKYGENRVISLHIEVDAEKSALEVHDVAERVEAAVESVVGGKAIVHVDPVDRTHPQYDLAESVMARVVENHPDVREFHDLRVSGPATYLHLTVDVVTVAGTSETNYPAIQSAVQTALVRQLHGIGKVNVTVEGTYGV